MSDDFQATVRATNANLANLATLGKAVGATASTLVSTGYEDLAHTPYQSTMRQLARQTSARPPELRRRLFAFDRHNPVLRPRAESRAPVIPEELLQDLPEDSSRVSLFAGFVASKDSSPARLKSGSRDALNHELDLLEIRKELASNEIREIDGRIAHLTRMRQLVFDRVAELEKHEFEVEARLREMGMNGEVEKESEVEDMEKTAEKEPEAGKGKEDRTEGRTEYRTEYRTEDRTEDRSEDRSQDRSQDREEDKKGDKKEKETQTPTKAENNRVEVQHSVNFSPVKHRRRTMPTLQQFYEPGAQIASFEAHEDLVLALDFDIPFGTLVSASRDTTCKVWDLGSRALKGSLTGHQASVRCLQLRDGLVATGSTDATVRLWDLDNLQLTWSSTDVVDDPNVDLAIQTLAAHQDEVTALYLEPTTLVSGSEDKTIRQWDLTSGRCLQTLDVLWAAHMYESTFDLGDSDHDKMSTTLDNWRPRRSLRHRSSMSTLGTVAGGSQRFVGALQSFDAALVSGTADGAVRLWDLRTGQVHRTLLGHTGPVTCLQFDNVFLATGSADRSVRIWDLRTGALHDAFAYDGPVTSLHMDARRVISAASAPSVKVYDREAQSHWSCGAGELSDDAEDVHCLKYREGYLVEGRHDGQVGVWAC